ncbi:MAG: hypothetical protein KAH35_00950 [Candidatus Atribacteria bacterium]|nr:hypothetical protein [Candidatus Atribacteria bacterium]
MQIKYKNKGDVPLIEAGVLVDNISWRYDLKPVQNKLIDQFSLVWEKEIKNDLLILKRPSFASNTIECNFFDKQASSSDVNTLAVYNYDLNKDYVLTDYEPINEDLEKIDNFHSLRASWQLTTYIKNEDLNFNFLFKDLNLNKEEDGIELLLFYRDELIDSRAILDDGIYGDSAQISEDISLNFRVPNLPEGVYKIQLRANDDIVTTEIASKQSKLVFVNNIRLIRESDEEFIIFSDSGKIQAKTIYPDSLQDIKIGDSKLRLTETYRQFESDISAVFATSGLKILEIEKDGIFLSGNGVFSFTSDAFFNPNIKRAVDGLNVNESGVNCIISGYKPPLREDDYYIANIFLDLKDAYHENNIYSFIISAPDLKIDDGVDDYLEIEEIRIKLKGKSLREKILEAISNY